MKTNFIPIDTQTWSRSQVFHYFSTMAPTSYSVTVELDITILKRYIKRNNLKFFPVYLWLVTNIINKQKEFKIAKLDNKLGYWEELTPMYACFHEDDKTISLMWTEYNENFNIFYDNYLENKKLYENNHGLLSQPHILPPANAYTVSCIPWLEFKHFSLHSYNTKPYYFPTIEAGKFIYKEDKIKLPISITVHHATTDGWHVSKFVEELQQSMNNFSN